MGSKVSFTAPYNPLGNGLSERANQEVLQVLHKNLNGDDHKWAHQTPKNFT
jgi:hypothetical protein